MPIHLHTVWGCFGTTSVEADIAMETVWSTKPKMSTIWSFSEEACPLLSSGLLAFLKEFAL